MPADDGGWHIYHDPVLFGPDEPQALADLIYEWRHPPVPGVPLYPTAAAAIAALRYHLTKQRISALRASPRCDEIRRRIERIDACLAILDAAD
jgi:hypothetical protein